MKKISTLILFSFIINTLSAQNVHWGGVVNTTYNDYIYDLQADKDNNLIICGQFSGTVDFDPGPGVANLVTTSGSNSDIFLAKYDSVGNYLWAHRFGTGFSYDECDRVAVDTSGNIFITGMWNGTVDFDPDSVNTFNVSSNNNSRSRFLAKYDTNGNFSAAKNVGNAVGSLPSSQDGQSGLGCDDDGNVYMSGFYGTSLTLAPGTTLPVSGLSDNYISKYNQQLDLIWGHRLGSNETEYSQGLFVHPEGNIIALGSFRNTIDFDPGPGVFNMTQVSSTQEGYFASYDSSGNFIFAKQLTAGTSASPIAALIDSDNNLIVTGSCAAIMDADPDTGVAMVGAGNNDQAFVAAYDSLGNYRWAFAYGDIASYNAIRYVGVDTANNIYVAGNYNPMMDIDPGADTAVFGNVYASYVASYDTAGNFRTAFSVQEVRMRIKNNDIFLAGGFYGLVDFDPGPQVYPLQSDTANASWYLLRMHQCDNFSETPGVISVPAICAGDTVTFSVSQGGPQYEWSFSPGLIPVGSVNGDSVTVAVDTAAVQETVFVYSVGGCWNSVLVYATVNVNQPVTPVITTNIVGDSLLTQTPAIYYQWYLDGLAIPNANDSLLYPLANGYYMVMTIDSNGCSAFSDSLFIILEGVSELKGLNVFVYPNPVTNELKIAFDQAQPEWQLIIADAAGKEMLTRNFSNTTETITTSDWSPGVYTLILTSAKGRIHKRIIKL